MRRIHVGTGLAMVAALIGFAGAGSASAELRLPWSPPAIDPANFVSRVTNPYLPLVPGTTLLYRGVMKDGTTRQTGEFTVTGRRKTVMGDQGNVWYFGEETQGLRHGHFGKMIGSGPAGVNGAEPGVIRLVGVTHRAARPEGVARPASPIESGAGPGWPATISPTEFVPRVTNPWFPLRPGSVWHYTGRKEGVRMVDTVRATHRTKRILGVATTVVHDVVTVDGRPEEVTDDFYAQDRHGNVWYFGEETKELDAQGRTTSTEGSFQAGVGGARAGVLVPGDPEVGMVGRQEFLEGEAEDHFKVLDLSARVSVSFVTTGRALRTGEWTPIEPGVLDNKYYVRGVGTVREVAVKGPVEELRLVSFRRG